jgi:GT2 family glycosyltransferase
MVLVVVVNWNGTRIVGECLGGLRRQIYRDFSVVVVDNGSSDDSVEFVRTSYPEVNVISLPENLGFCVANNIAMRGIERRYVALLNNDAVPEPSWLGTLVETLETVPEAGFAASKMLLWHDRKKIDRAGDAYTRAGTGRLRGRGSPASKYDDREWIFGACAGAALYRTSMLSDIGFFDEDLFLLYEDVDLSFRAQLMGYRCLYVPQAIVYHRASGSIVHDSPVSVYYSHRNLEWVYIKNMPKRLIVKTIIPHLIYNIGALVYFAAVGRLKHFVRAKVDAVKGMDLAWRKRQRIQARKRVDDLYVWNLLEKERFLPRLARRLTGT